MILTFGIQIEHARLEHISPRVNVLAVVSSGLGFSRNRCTRHRFSLNDAVALASSTGM
jgi:hypothetical protein